MLLEHYNIVGTGQAKRSEEKINAEDGESWEARLRDRRGILRYAQDDVVFWEYAIASGQAETGPIKTRATWASMTERLKRILRYAPSLRSGQARWRGLWR